MENSFKKFPVETGILRDRMQNAFTYIISPESAGIEILEILVETRIFGVKILHRLANINMTAWIRSLCKVSRDINGIFCDDIE